MTVSSINSQNIPVVAPGSADRALDQNAFLTLMTTQLRAQDPFNPTDNQEMVAQMAQFSSVAGISEMNSSLKDIADMIAAQTQLLADIREQTAPAPATTTGA